MLFNHTAADNGDIGDFGDAVEKWRAISIDRFVVGISFADDDGVFTY
jgi:hypothetical protein